MRTHRIGEKTFAKNSSGRAATSGKCFGAFEREHFRHKLAEHDMQKGNDTKGDDDGAPCAKYAAGPSPAIASAIGKRSSRDRRFADPAESKRRERDAELNGGDK